MKNTFLVIIDMQNDFVTGSLGTKEAEAVVPAVLQKAADFKGQIIFTQDTHEGDYLSTQEGKHLPVEHCIAHTEGWELVDGLKELQEKRGNTVYRKHTFGSIELASDLLSRHRKNQVESIELIGLCTDICIVSNALLLKAHLPEVPVIVDASCCAGVTPEKHKMALEVMESCQVIVTNK